MNTPSTAKENIGKASLQQYFDQFRQNVIGKDQVFESPFGKQKIIYADWTASGRMYRPIEDLISHEIAPFVGNTHTETTITGSSMTLAYHKAKDIIKDHVNASDEDILISSKEITVLWDKILSYQKI